MNRRSLLSAAMAGAFASVAARVRPPKPALIPLRVEAREGLPHLWRVFRAENDEEIGQDIPIRWAEKFGRAKIGEPFHFTVFRRDKDGKYVVGPKGIVQDRVRGVIVQKVM